MLWITSRQLLDRGDGVWRAGQEEGQAEPAGSASALEASSLPTITTWISFCQCWPEPAEGRQ